MIYWIIFFGGVISFTLGVIIGSLLFLVQNPIIKYSGLRRDMMVCLRERIDFTDHIRLPEEILYQKLDAAAHERLFKEVKKHIKTWNTGSIAGDCTKVESTRHYVLYVYMQPGTYGIAERRVIENYLNSQK